MLKYTVAITLGIGSVLMAGCAQPASVASVDPPKPLTVAETLRADPRFSDFVTVIDFAGMGHELDTARNFTVFAPTNAAFDRSEPGWRASTSGPKGIDNFDINTMARQNVIRQQAVVGIHPPSDFIGKMQDVRSVGGRIFHVNGMVPGAITVTAGIPNPTGMGFPVRPDQTLVVGLPPITASDGLIYPMDAIMR